MAAQLSELSLTPDKYLALERAAEYKSEYILGEMVAMSGASGRHERIVVNLTFQLASQLRGKSCQPTGGNLRVRVRSTNYVYPDLTVTCGDMQYADKEYLDTLLNPTVVFEILSPSTESRDYGVKWRLYQTIESLKHYVLIDQSLPYVSIYTRQSDTEWIAHSVSSLDGEIVLSAIGVTIPMAGLYENLTFAPEP